MTYKWLLFDLDGTLFDYDQAEQNALRHTFRQMGYPFEETYLALYREINHQLWLDFEKGKIDQTRLKRRRFELLSEAINLQYDPQEFSTNYLSNLGQSTFLMRGAEETVKVLEKKFYLAVITNGLKEVQRPRLANSVIQKYIQVVVISDEVGAAKPDPKIFDIAFEQMNYPAKREVLIIGDSLTSDIQGGLNYGIDTCWFNPAGQTNGQIASTLKIRCLTELPRILEAVKPAKEL